MTQSQLKQTVKITTICLTILFVVLLFVIMFQYVYLHRLKAQAKALDESIAQKQQQIEDLLNGIANREDPTFAEDYAREEMGKIKDGEVIYVFQ